MAYASLPNYFAIAEFYMPADEDEIDVGSRIGIEIDGEEVYGEIIEFDDEEETVTIIDEESGDEITGSQDDMFLE